MALLLLATGLRPAVAGDTFIQLGAERSEEAAAQKWEDIRARTGTVLEGMVPRISSVDVKHKGRLYRLRAGPTEAASAASICAQLKAQAIDCIVVH
ncbi:MAG: SPOR domain-containing protein [Alphaproteobacteria bacterium]|nr:SPOR domain-containing protein [Alphaproteobacteria bacterium]